MADLRTKPDICRAVIEPVKKNNGIIFQRNPHPRYGPVLINENTFGPS